jgi:flagellar hook protein FlgE
MMRSLYSGISGLKNHQTRMDVIGNNIANVNTAGFKASRVVFQDIYSQTSASAAAPLSDGTNYLSGGTNPMQIGLGIKLAAIDVLHTPAAIARSDRELDVMIEGDGFFVVSDTTNDIDPDAVDSASLYYTRAGNFYLDADGNLVTASGMFVRGVMADTGDLEAFASDGVAEEELEIIKINYSDYTNISIDKSGVIQGLDNANNKVAIGAIAIATFVNPAGLEKMGDSLYVQSRNSGLPGGGSPNDAAAESLYYQSGTNGAGDISAGGLEMSNVDLATEFTDMIVTQRGFQANSRIITVSDTLLEELVNLKR